MNWFTGVVVYLLSWWICIFLVLPWGLKHEDIPEEGHAGGAPINPQLKKKFLINTVLAAIVTGIIFALIKADIIDFNAIAMQMLKEDS